MSMFSVYYCPIPVNDELYCLRALRSINALLYKIVHNPMFNRNTWVNHDPCICLCSTQALRPVLNVDT